ncbi:MAG TPA: hypothetical protein VD968_05325 [Pyrinomonadaceae bacterium]|nr:hypothetical protein [Pyrinomonadaceae bacterium]
MTPQDHNKVLGIMHLIYGGMNAILLPFVFIFVFLGAGLTSIDPSAPPEAGLVFVLIGLFFGLLFLMFGLPPLLAGYGMLRRKSWARGWGIAAAVFAALSFPLGTALCVYTLWFLLGNEGKGFYEGRADWRHQEWRGSLGAARQQGWGAQSSTYGRQAEYVPPPQPPDWRGDS